MCLNTFSMLLVDFSLTKIIFYKSGIKKFLNEKWFFKETIGSKIIILTLKNIRVLCK